MTITLAPSSLFSHNRVAALTIATALLAGGCGGDEPTVADLAPPDTALLVEAQVRPEDDTAAVAERFAARLLGTTQPRAVLGRVAEKALEDAGARIDFTRDVEPWLGDRVGGFLAGDSSRPEVAVIAEVRDQEAATAFAEGRAFEGDVEARLIEDFLVIGSKEGVASAREAARDGNALDDRDDYQGSVDALDEDRLAHLWIDGPRALETAGLSGPSTQLGESPGAAELLVDGDTATVQATAGIESMRRSGFLGPDVDTNAVDLLPEVPERAVLASGVPALGGLVKAGLDDPARLGVSPSRVGPLRRQLRRVVGADVESLLDEAGDTVLYLGQVDASYLPEPVEAALAARVEDPDAYLRRLGASLRRIPRVGYRFRPSNTTTSREPSAEVKLPGGDFIDLQARSDDGLFIAAYSVVADAMFASPPLSDTDGYRNAVRTLGEGFGPVLYLDPRGALAALRRAGALGNTARSPALRALRRIASVLASDRRSGDRLTTRVTINLR